MCDNELLEFSIYIVKILSFLDSCTIRQTERDREIPWTIDIITFILLRFWYALSLLIKSSNKAYAPLDCFGNKKYF